MTKNECISRIREAIADSEDLTEFVGQKGYGKQFACILIESDENGIPVSQVKAGRCEVGLMIQLMGTAMEIIYDASDDIDEFTDYVSQAAAMVVAIKGRGENSNG